MDTNTFSLEEPLEMNYVRKLKTNCVCKLKMNYVCK